MHRAEIRKDIPDTWFAVVRHASFVNQAGFECVSGQVWPAFCTLPLIISVLHGGPQVFKQFVMACLSVGLREPRSEHLRLPYPGAWHGRVERDVCHRSVYGTVAAIRLANRPVAMRDAASEARVYERLQRLQGECVPRLIAHGPLSDTKAYFVATEFMEVC